MITIEQKTQTGWFDLASVWNTAAAPQDLAQARKEARKLARRFRVAFRVLVDGTEVAAF